MSEKLGLRSGLDECDGSGLIEGPKPNFRVDATIFDAKFSLTDAQGAANWRLDRNPEFGLREAHDLLLITAGQHGFGVIVSYLRLPA
jgi:hypothetical protein